MTLDFNRCRLPPFAHQRADVEWLIARPFAFIASEMRTGKSKIVIDAAQFLYEARVIDKVIIVAPAPVRDVWADATLGELTKHLWLDLRADVTEYHARVRTWSHGPPITDRTGIPLDFFVTNYEFLRSKARLAQLLAVAGPKTLLVLDESSFVKNHAAQQTKACLQLRRACGRVVLLNGTPLFHSPLDLFSQGNILHQSVLDCKFITLFKARYAVQAPVLGYGGKPLTSPYGKAIQAVVSWTNLDDLQRRFAPYTVRRLQSECLDLPPKLDPVTLTATLTPETWRAYKDMRDELVVWLKSDPALQEIEAIDNRGLHVLPDFLKNRRKQLVATSATAAVKALRLSQITGGFLGGIEDANIEPVDAGLLESLTPGGMRDQVQDVVKLAQRAGVEFSPGRLEVLNNLDIGVAGVSRPSVYDAVRTPVSRAGGEATWEDPGTSPSHLEDQGEQNGEGLDTAAGGETGHPGRAAEADPDGATPHQSTQGLGSNHDGNKVAGSTPTRGALSTVPYQATEAIGREKLDVLLWFIAHQLESDPNLHLVAWCRFRAELLRMVTEVKKKFPQFECGVIMGGQTVDKYRIVDGTMKMVKEGERGRVLRLLKPETSPSGPVFVAGIEGTGSFGLDFTAAHTCVTMSSGYSPGRSAQTLDRVYGPGQKFPIAYYDIVAVGPRGQKTIDRDILVARRAGQDVATWTAAHWVKALTEEA